MPCNFVFVWSIFGTVKDPKKQTDSPWTRVAENLYRYKPKGTYYAAITRRGKLIRNYTFDGSQNGGQVIVIQISGMS